MHRPDFSGFSRSAKVRDKAICRNQMLFTIAHVLSVLSHLKQTRQVAECENDLIETSFPIRGAFQRCWRARFQGIVCDSSQGHRTVTLISIGLRGPFIHLDPLRRGKPIPDRIDRGPQHPLHRCASEVELSAFKKLDPVPQFKATAKLGEFLNQLPA